MNNLESEEEEALTPATQEINRIFLGDTLGDVVQGSVLTHFIICKHKWHHFPKDTKDAWRVRANTRVSARFISGELTRTPRRLQHDKDSMLKKALRACWEKMQREFVCKK